MMAAGRAKGAAVCVCCQQSTFLLGEEDQNPEGHLSVIYSRKQIVDFFLAISSLSTSSESIDKIACNFKAVFVC